MHCIRKCTECICWPCYAISHALERERDDPMIEFLLLGQTRYSDWFCIDFGFYLRQQHTILAVCLSNRLHPYSKVFRLYVLLANLAFSFCVSGFVGWLDHLQSPWYIPVSFVISPVVIFLLTTALEQLAICGIVRVDGTRRIYRWAGLGIGHILFYLIWIMLVPCCVLLGLLFSSFRSCDITFKIYNNRAEQSRTDMI